MEADSVVASILYGKGLNKRWMGVWFSLLITVAYGLIFNSVQANTVTIAFENAFGLERTIVGALLALLVAVIIFGGIKSISRITEMIVPPMAIIYIGVAILLLLTTLLCYQAFLWKYLMVHSV